MNNTKELQVHTMERKTAGYATTSITETKKPVVQALGYAL